MSQVDLTIKNGKLVSPKGIIQAGLAVDRGKVVMVAEDTFLCDSRTTIDAKGNYILPGLIDPHFHPGVRGFARDMEVETRSAAAGGITTAGAMNSAARMARLIDEARFDSQPGSAEGQRGPAGQPTAGSPEPPSFKRAFPILKEQIEKHSTIDIFLTFAITNDTDASEIPDAADFGVTSFKFYVGYKGGDKVTGRVGLGKFSSLLGFPNGFDDGTIYLGFENIASLKGSGLALLHAENMEIARIFFDRTVREGRRDLIAWADRSPPLCEAIDIKTYAYLAKLTGCPLYIVHLSSALGLEEVVKAQQEGINIIAETCPQYLVVNKYDDPPGVFAKVNPAIKGREDNERLWQGLRDSVIQCMGTDHVSTTRGACQGEELFLGEIPAKNTGFVGMETLLPSLLSEGVNKGRLSLEKLVEICCENNAKAFGLYPTKGCLQPGSDADITIVDLNKSLKVTQEVLHTDSNAIFETREFKGWPVKTILRGQVIYDRKSDSFPERPRGRYLARAVAG